MAYTATIYKVFITASEELSTERMLLENSILKWNENHSEKKKAYLFPYYCDSVESFNPSEFDMIFGAYWTKLKDYKDSSFQEKVIDYINEGNPARFYFSNKDIPKSMLDITKWSELEKFKNSLFTQGLVREYNDEEHLMNQMDIQISKTVDGLSLMTKMFEEAKDDQLSLEKFNAKKKSGFFNYIGTIEDIAKDFVQTIGDFIMQSGEFASKLEEQFQKETSKSSGFGNLSLETGKLFSQFTKDIELSMRNYEYIWAEFSSILSRFTNNIDLHEANYLSELKDLIEHLIIGLESAKSSLVPFKGNFNSFGGSLDFNLSARILTAKLAYFSQNLDKSLEELKEYKEKMNG